MNTEKIQVYLVPGLAAGKEIFRNIHLPKDTFETHVIEWLLPEKREPIQVYAKRMAALVKHNNAVLIGVSFGGVVVQEMSLHLNLKSLIIISSVKCRHELPRRLKFVSKTGLYRLMPTGLILSTDDLTKFAVGPRSKKRLSLYNDYLHVRDKTYLNWSIRNMVCWKRTQPVNDVVHIHGNADMVFPFKYIEDCMVVEGGSHVMLLNKGKEVGAKIEQAILDK